MQRHETNTVVEIDDRWFPDWIKFGFEEMERYLALYNNFRTYCDLKTPGE
jgi:hypothetical protein